MAKHARISPRARRRGITIAAGALTVSMVSPFVQSVVAPNSVTQATAQESEYVPANVGQPFSNETSGILRYANAQNQPEFNSTTGADAMITLSHWWQASASRGSVFGTNTSNPDGGMLFLNFRDPAFYEAIDRIDIVGQSGDPADIQASMYKRDPAGSEWQVALKDYSFVGIGTDYQSNALIYLKDGVNINSLPKPDLGFYVDSYYTTYDGKVARESVSSTTITGGLFWQSADGFPDEIITDPASIANWLRTQARKGVRYDQLNNSITSTTTFTPRENFLQASYSWSAVFRENIDKAIVPFVESVEIYSSDMYGNQRSGSKSFSLYLDPATGQVTSERNTDISWKAGEEITAQTYSKVRSNQDDIFYGTLGQTRSFTIKYHLKPGSATDLQETTSQQLINAASGDVYFDVQTWLEADFADKWVWGVSGPTDGGADSMAVPLSYTHSYVNVVDSDGDGLTDEYEAQIGSDSSNPDTDGDGVPDGQEQLIDKTDPLDAKSYIPAGPTSERTRVIAAKLNEVSGTAPKVEYPNPLAEGTNLEVTSTEPIPTRVYLVPVNALTRDADGKLRVNTAGAIATDTYENLDELMAGSFTLNPTSTTATPGEYTLVAVSPAGEVTRGSNITIADPQTDDFDATIEGVAAVPLEAASTDPAEFTNDGAPADAPAGVTYEILPKDGYTVVTDGVAAEPGEVSIADNGAVTFVPRAEDANTSVTFQVRVTYEDLSEDLVDVVFTVGDARDTDGDGIPDYQDPDQGGETTDWRTLTHGVRVDGQVINSDGEAGADELPETLRGLTVTLSNGADSVTSGGADAWRGAENYPLVKNFDLHQFGLGDYTATIGGADAWADTYVLLPSGLNSGQPLTVTGETGTQYVNFETKQTTAYPSPDAPLARATNATPTFSNGTTDSTRKNTDSTFKLGALPEGYSVPADGAVASKPGEVSINAETGAVTFVPRVEDIGGDVVIPVTTVFVDGTEAESEVTFQVGDGQTANLDPSYGDVDAVPTKPSTTNLNLAPGQSLPADTTFEGVLEGYTQVDADPEPGQFTIDEQGNVTLVPRLEDADKPLALVVTLTYPDGSGDTADAVFNVGQDLAGIIEPSYDETPANPARRATSPLILGEDQVLPSGTQLSGVVEGANGTYSKVNTLAEVVPGTFFISPSGAVTINPLLEDANNDNLAVAVTFTYPDGSSETARAAFPVGATLSQSFAAQYQAWTSVAFEKTVIPAPTVTPEYTSTVTYKAGEVPAGYTVKASAAEVTAAGDYFVAPNGGITVIPLAQSPVEFPVVATFADQSTQPITATLTVTSQAEAYAPSYETIPVEPAAVKSSAVIGDVPTGARFTATLEGYTPVDSAQDVPLGSFFIDPDTGLITVGIKPDQPRGELQALVTVTYPDGSQDENIPAVFDVSDNEAAKNSVNYQPVDAQPTVAVSATPVLNEGSPTPTYEGVSVHGAEGFTKVETTDGIAPGQYHVDTNTGVVTLVPRLEDANKRISVAVEATYPGDGSTAISDAVFNVGPSIADGMDPTYSPNYEAIAAQPIIPQDAKLQLGEGQTLPEGTTFSGALTGGQEPYTLVTEGNAQNPGEYSIAEDGTVWIVPRLEDADATLTVAVTLTYSDGSTDQADAVFQVGSAITDSYDPAYQDITGTPGLPATIAAPTGLPETGRTSSAETPAGFTAVEYAEAVTAPGHFFFDTTTGEITLVPRIEDANKTVAVPVTVTYSDGSVDRLSPKVTVGTQASAYAPAYAPVPALPGVEVSIDAPVSDPAVPEGTTYTLGADLPAGYSADNVALAADGSITLTPPADAPVGTVSIPVVVKYPDGSEETIRATVNVQPLDGSVDFTVEGAAAQPGIPVTGGEAVFTEQGANEPADKPVGTTFSGTLEGYELQESRDDVNAPGEFYVDPETGAVTISAALEDAGETVEVKVTATYTDGTTDSAVAKFNVGDTQATTYAPEYAGAKAVINSPVTQDQLADNLPEGTKFSGELPGYTPAENPEEVKPGEFYVDPITGQVTVNAKLDDASQDLVVGVTVSYPDTSAETVDATFTVSKALSAVHVGTYGPTRGVVGEKTVIAAPTFDAELPEGVVPTFTLGEVAGYTAVDSADAVANEGHFYINPDGSIVVIPLAAGVVNIPVTVKFSDQSTAEITAPLTVATQAATYSPYYSSVNALPDNVSSSPLRTARTLPEGTTFEGSLEGYVEGNPDDLQRGQFYVNPDTGEVKVRPTLSDADKTLYVNVVATYADGSTDPMQAQFVVGPTRAAQFDASYDEQQALPAQVATSEPVLEDTFPTTAEFSGALDGYAEAAGADNVQPGQFFVDSSTGVVSVNPKLEDWGKPLSVAITVTYRDGSTDETTAAFAVGTQASTVDPEYPESTVKQEGKTTVEVTLPEGQQWPEGDLTFTEAEDNPNVEVAQDGTLTVTAPEGAQVGDVIEGTIIVTYPDGSTDELPYKFTVTAKDNVPSTLEDIDDQTVVEGKPITSVTPEASGDAPTITVDGLPDGVIFEDGTISGTPVVEEWGDDEARTFTVTITVSDTGDEDLVKTFDITVERDTDGDGVPDVNDEDDDGDGFTDAEEIKAGSDPKDPASTPAGVVLASVTVVEGQVIDPVAVKATVPAGGSVAVAGLPEGLSFDPDSGEVLGTPDRLSDWGDTEESREFDVTVTVVNADGDVVASDEVVWTVQRDTDGDGEPDLTDTDDDGDGVPDENEIAAGSDPKDPGSIPGTLIVPVAGIDPVADQSVVEGTEIDPFVVDPVKDEATVEVTVPEGLVFDEASGEVSGTPVVDVWGSDEESRDLDVVIVVTNPDGSKVTETVVVTVERDTDGDGEPDATDSDDDGDGFTDAEEIAAGSDPKDPGSIPATPLEPGTPSDAAEHEPDYQTTPVPVGGTETSNDPFEEDVELTGVTADPAEGWTLTPDDETGEITATAPSLGELAQAWEDAVAQAGETPLFDDLVAELGDILRPTVGVDVTYADGSQDLRKDASFVVVDASGNEFTPDGDFDGDGVTNAEELANGTNPFTTDEQSPAPDWTDVDNAEPGVELVIENIGGTVPEGATVRVPEGKGEATIGDNGDITFTPAEGVEPGETIELIVEDAEGNEIGRVTVTIGEDSPVVPVPDPGSSFDANKCFPAALGVGIPLLLLIPVGLSTQLDIPGMNPLVGQLSKEIQRINAEVTRASVRELKSNGLWIEPTPEMVRINELLRSVDPEVGRRAGGIALAAAGALALGFVVVSCMPGGSSMSSGSSGSSGSSLSSGSSMWGSSN